jgi:hypothetical protein
MLKNIFTKFKERQEKTSKDVNSFEESGKNKPEDVQK